MSGVTVDLMPGATAGKSKWFRKAPMKIQISKDGTGPYKESAFVCFATDSAAKEQWCAPLGSHSTPHSKGDSTSAPTPTHVPDACMHARTHTHGIFHSDLSLAPCTYSLTHPPTNPPTHVPHLAHPRPMLFGTSGRRESHSKGRSYSTPSAHRSTRAGARACGSVDCWASGVPTTPLTRL